MGKILKVLLQIAGVIMTVGALVYLVADKWEELNMRAEEMRETVAQHFHREEDDYADEELFADEELAN